MKVLYITIVDYDGKVKNGQIKDAKQCAQTLTTVIKESVSLPGVHVIDVTGKEFAVLAFDSAERITGDTIERIKTTANLYLNLTLSVEISGAFTEPAEISAHYKACREADKYKFYRKPTVQAIQYINDNIYRKISLNDVANAVSMSVGYLCKLFKNETGKSVVGYINELKIAQAAELLKDPESMVKEVANMVGIKDQFYFNKIFKLKFGMSPSEYKKTLMKKN